MAVGTSQHTSTRSCPCCGQRYAFRVPARLDASMNLTRYYRCGRAGAYLYVHEIKYRP